MTRLKRLAIATEGLRARGSVQLSANLGDVTLDAAGLAVELTTIGTAVELPPLFAVSLDSSDEVTLQVDGIETELDDGSRC